MPYTHWIASAYLFCTLIEQKILQLIPIPVVEHLVNADDVRMSDSIVFSGSNMEDQIKYLRNTKRAKEDE